MYGGFRTGVCCCVRSYDHCTALPFAVMCFFKILVDIVTLGVLTHGWEIDTVIL